MISRGVESVESHRAGARRSKAEQRLDEGRLARAVRSEQRDDFAVVDVHRDVLNGSQVTEGDLQLVDVNGVTHEYRTYRVASSTRRRLGRLGA
jgi:hypothetical protein